MLFTDMCGLVLHYLQILFYCEFEKNIIFVSVRKQAAEVKYIKKK